MGHAPATIWQSAIIIRRRVDPRQLAFDGQYHFPFLHVGHIIISIHCREDTFGFFWYHDSPGNCPTFCKGDLSEVLHESIQWESDENGFEEDDEEEYEEI